MDHLGRLGEDVSCAPMLHKREAGDLVYGCLLIGKFL